MNLSKPKLYKRIGAYIIDLLVIALISSVVATVFTNTEKYKAILQEMKEISSKYNEASNELKELSENKNNHENEEEYNLKYEEKKKELDNYIDKIKDLNYEYLLSSNSVTIIMLIMTIIYYVIMSYFCHGITLGKYIMKIRIVSINDNELNIFNYLLRSLIINNVLSNIASIITINTLPKADYFVVDEKVSGIFSLLLLVSFIFMMYREDGRGLHDLIAKTKVVNIDYKLHENDEEIKEAKIISKTDKKNKNGTKKKI